eukprot:scaffold137374_cov31-Tisochrysis_lutea.AAC.2
MIRGNIFLNDGCAAVGESEDILRNSCSCETVRLGNLRQVQRRQPDTFFFLVEFLIWGWAAHAAFPPHC